jgi:hypothetical protein
VNLATATLMFVGENSKGLTPGIYSRNADGTWTLTAERVRGAWYYRKFNHVTRRFDYEPFLANDQQLLDEVERRGTTDATRR